MTAPDNAPQKPEHGEFQTVVWDDGKQCWWVRDLTAEEWAEKFPQPAPVSPPTADVVVRFQRNQLLSESDWTQVADAPVDQAVWATYRQALRNVPQQAGFPDNVTWPTKPE